jgi:hypothetical protein
MTLAMSSPALVTNDHKTSAPKVITRYAQRMLIENALSDAVRFFHMNALTPPSASRSTSTWRCS